MMIHRATAFFYLYPKAFISPHARVLDTDIERWSIGFTWEQDGWNGYKDFVSYPVDTVTSAAGDCDDYAAVAASWEYKRDNDVELLFLYKDGWPPIPEHVVAASRNRIYDSGHIWKDTTPEEYLEQTSYDSFNRRKV